MSQQGPPYLPPTAPPGLRPNPSQDTAASAVFLALYIGSAICHQIIYQRNKRRGQKFLLSLVMFGFAMARTLTMSLRIGAAYRPNNISLAIASLIFINVGVLAEYVIVLLLTLRLCRALQPRIGWNPTLRTSIHISYWLLGLMICLVVAFVVTSYYTLDPSVLQACKWIPRVGVLYFLLFNVTSLVLFLLAVLLPRASDAENFGSGSMRSKIIVLAAAIFFAVFIAGFRMGTSWENPSPLSDPAWYDTRPAFYLIELGFEIVITYLFIFTRFDNRFWIPNGSTKPGDYSSMSLAECRQNFLQKKRPEMVKLEEAHGSP